MQSLMAIAISAVLAVLGVTSYWTIMDKTYAVKIAQQLESQMDYIIDQSYIGFRDMEDVRYQGVQDPSFPNGDGDYLDDLIAKGILPPLPLDGFNDPESLIWAIRAPVISGQHLYYIHITSEDTGDRQLVLRALSMVGIPDEYIDQVVP